MTRGLAIPLHRDLEGGNPHQGQVDNPALVGSHVTGACHRGGQGALRAQLLGPAELLRGCSPPAWGRTAKAGSAGDRRGPCRKQRTKDSGLGTATFGNRVAISRTVTAPP